MAAVDLASLDAGARAQLVLGYTTLLLHDGKQPVNEETIKKVVEASGNKADAGAVKALAKALKHFDVSSLFNVGGGGSGSAPAQASSQQQEKPKATAPEPKKEEKVEEEDVDVGVGDLFGF